MSERRIVDRFGNPYYSVNGAPSDGDVGVWDSSANGGAGGFVMTSSSGFTPYMYPFKDAIDDPINDNFRGVSLDTAGTRFTGAAPWTTLNPGAATYTLSGGRLWLTSPASASVQIRAAYVAVPSGNWCIRAPLSFRPSNGTDTTEKNVGMFLRDSSSGKCETFGIGYTGGTTKLWLGTYTNPTTYNVATGKAQALTGSVPPAFFEIEYDGTDYRMRIGGADGQMYIPHTDFWIGKTSWLSAAADGIGLFSENDQSIATTLVCSGFYRVAVSSVL